MGDEERAAEWLKAAGVPPLPADEFFDQDTLDKVMESNDRLWADTVEAMALESMILLQKGSRAPWDEAAAAEAVARAYGVDSGKVQATPIMKAVLDQVLEWMAPRATASAENRAPILRTAALLFDPSNPPPFPEPGMHSGLWGWIEQSDIEELWFLVNNDQNLYNLAMRALNPKGDDTLYQELDANDPRVLAFLRQNFEAINAEFLYPHLEDVGPLDVREIAPKLRELYKSNPQEGERQLARLISQFDADDIADMEEDLGKDGWTRMMEGLQTFVNKSKGKPEPSRKTKMRADDVPSIDADEVARRKDEALDRFNAGELDDAQFQAEMDRLNRMGMRRAAADLPQPGSTWVLRDDPEYVIRVDAVDGDSVLAFPAGGGFRLRIPARDFAADFLPQEGKAKPQTGMFVIEDGRAFPGYYRAGERWNGWHMPFFEKATAEQVLAGMFEKGHFGYDPERDVFWSEFEEGEREEWPGEPFGGRHLYGIGAGSWIWSRMDDPRDAPETPAEVSALNPQDRQQKLDQLLDQYSAEEDPARREQLEQQMHSLGKKHDPLDNLRRECDHAEKPGGWCGRCEGRAPKKAKAESLVENPDRDQEMFEFQDSQIEALPKRLQDHDEANWLGVRLENAGDIFRELVWRDHADEGYIGEKASKIRLSLSRPHTLNRELTPEARAIADRIAELFGGLDLSGKSDRLAAARDLNVALAKQDLEGAAAALDRIDVSGL